MSEREGERKREEREEREREERERGKRSVCVSVYGISGWSLNIKGLASGGQVNVHKMTFCSVKAHIHLELYNIL